MPHSAIAIAQNNDFATIPVVQLTPG